MVRQQVLILRIEGSNPSSPTNKKPDQPVGLLGSKTLASGYSHGCGVERQRYSVGLTWIASYSGLSARFPLVEPGSAALSGGFPAQKLKEAAFLPQGPLWT